MEAVKKQPELTPKQQKAQNAYRERAEHEWSKYMEFLRALVDGYTEMMSGVEDDDKDIYNALNIKWRTKSSAVAKFNKYIRPMHQLFELTIAEMKQETGIPLTQYVTGLEDKLREISDAYHLNKDDKEAFYNKVNEVLTRKIVQNEIQKEETEQPAW